MNEKEAASKLKKDFEDLFYTAVGFSVMSGKRIYGTIREIAKDYRPDEHVNHMRERTTKTCGFMKNLMKDALANMSKRPKGFDHGE
jgi:hypothetical protein